MTYKVDDLKRDIRVAIDQNADSSPLLNAGVGDIDTLTMEQIIESKIVDAVRIVTAAAPHYLLDSGKDFTTDICWDSRTGVGSGHVCLPADFLRLVSFKMSDWERAATLAITEEHPLYAQQSSRYAGIRGNTQRPVVAVVMRPKGQVLEFYSCAAGEGVCIDMARYIAMPQIVKRVVDDTTVSEIDIPEKLKDAAVYYAAYLVALSTGQVDVATAMQSICNELMK